MATLIPSLAALRDEFNRLAPGRGKVSDGWIGNAAHQAGPSDHNPDSRGFVHAIDVDKNLKVPGVTMKAIVDHLVAECRAGREDRLTYVIFDRGVGESRPMIASASRGWTWRNYSGSNPHDKHAHFSGSANPTKERDASRWNLIKEDELPSLDATDKKDIRAIVTEEVDKALSAFGKRDPLATILARSGEQRDRMSLAVSQISAISTAVNAIQVDGLSDQEITDLARQIAAGLPTDLAERTVDALRERLA